MLLRLLRICAVRKAALLSTHTACVGELLPETPPVLVIGFQHILERTIINAGI